MASTAYYPDDPFLEELMQGPSFEHNTPMMTGGTEGMPANYPVSPQAPQGPQIDPYGLSSPFEGAPSYIPMSGVPQPQMPPELQALIGGQGYDPATLAQMRASAVEDVSNAALPQMGAMRRGLSAAGIGPQNIGGANYMAQIGRRTGDQQSAALRDISINNAMVGNNNRQFGLNQAHQWAMENANRLFSAMSQNLGESGSNTRTAVSLGMNQQPFAPAGGVPKESGIAPAVTGAANSIPAFGQDQKQNPMMPQPNPMAPQGDQAFGKNPFKGYA